MDDYLTEKEQIERVKEWWRENGWYLIGGAVVAGLGYLGYNQYRAYEARVAEDAAALYQELVQAVEDDDRMRTDELLGELIADHSGSGYLDQARLLIASDNLIRDTARSIGELEAVVAAGKDEGLVMIARSRLARVLAYDEQYDRALEVLSVPDPGEFGPVFSEIRGDIHAANGDVESAVAAYTEALVGGGSGTINTATVQLKLSDLLQAQQAQTIELIEPDDAAESEESDESEDSAESPESEDAG